MVHHHAFLLTVPRLVCSRWTSSAVQLLYTTMHFSSLCLIQCVPGGPPAQSSCGTSPCISPQCASSSVFQMDFQHSPTVVHHHAFSPHCASSSVFQVDLQRSPAVVHHHAFLLTVSHPVCSRWTSNTVQLWYITMHFLLTVSRPVCSRWTPSAVQLWYITMHFSSLCLVQCVPGGPPTQSSCGTT